MASPKSLLPNLGDGKSYAVKNNVNVHFTLGGRIKEGTNWNILLSM